jgi:hypothetical protein
MCLAAWSRLSVRLAGFVYCPTAEAMKCVGEGAGLSTASGAVCVDVTEGGVSNVALSCDELSLAVATANRVLFYDISALSRGEKVCSTTVHLTSGSRHCELGMRCFMHVKNSHAVDGI